MTKTEFDRHGNQRWFKNKRLHREGGPAVIYIDGTQFWFRNGLYHREDGPAWISSDGEKAWYLNGMPLTKEEWWERIPDEMKLKALFNGEGE